MGGVGELAGVRRSSTPLKDPGTAAPARARACDFISDGHIFPGRVCHERRGDIPLVADRHAGSKIFLV